ncbi:MAG: malonyl-ACP O-methyltransferase BioC [Betaproteobacteria bacterium]
MNAPTVDSRQVRRNFQRAASAYDAASFFQQEVNRRMLERLDYVKIEPARVLDLGCGTGVSLTALSERYPKSRLVGADACEAMLQAGGAGQSRLRWLMPFLRGSKAALVAADASALPFTAGSMGLVWSNLMLHWLDDPLKAFREMQRVLDVGGLLMFSTLGPDSLKELRSCFSDGYEHTQRFADMHDLGDMLLAAGYSDPVMDAERLTLTYAGIKDLFRDLRQNGAGCAMHARRHGLMGRTVWGAAEEKYAALVKDGRLPATFEVVYGHAWKALPKKDAEGNAVIRFEPKQRSR